MKKRSAQLQFEVLPQPDDTTCGPTCLHAIYRYWGEGPSLSDVVSEVKELPEGGTLAVSLACHALRRGFNAEIYTYNLQLCDPTWFIKPGVDLEERLRAQQEVKADPKLTLATEAYLEFLSLGGSLKHQELTGALLRGFLKRQVPILAGLSATYLYRCSREHNGEYNDVRGEPMGHFVVLSGYDRTKREVMVADPLGDNPGFRRQYYPVSMNRLIASILLGIVTFDANLLVITPKDEEVT